MVLARNFQKSPDKKFCLGFFETPRNSENQIFLFFLFFFFIYRFLASYGTQLYAISSIIPPKNFSVYYRTLSIPPQRGPDVLKSPNYSCHFCSDLMMACFFFFFVWIFGILCASTISHYLEIYKKNQSSVYYRHFYVPPSPTSQPRQPDFI